MGPTSVQEHRGEYLERLTTVSRADRFQRPRWHARVQAEVVGDAGRHEPPVEEESVSLTRLKAAYERIRPRIESHCVDEDGDIDRNQRPVDVWRRPRSQEVAYGEHGAILDVRWSMSQLTSIRCH